MDRDQLAALDLIVREGSFTRAAVALNVGQPAVSARVRALEQEVGGDLFTRGRRVGLTALGESFLPYARRALEVLGEGVEAARQAQVGQRGRVRLGSLASLASGLVGPALGRFMGGHPEVDCTMRAGDHERIVDLLLDGLVELGVVAWPCTESATADLQPLLVFRERVVLTASPRHPLALTSRVGLQELERLGRPLFRLRWWQQHHPGLIALADRAGAAIDSPMEAARALALAGRGVGVFVETFIAEDLQRKSLVEVTVQDLEPVHRDSALVRRRVVGGLSPAAAALVEELRRRAEELGILGGAQPRPRRKRR